MPTEAIIAFGQKHVHLFPPPFLEIGSKVHPGYHQYAARAIHGFAPPDEWLGVDIEEGQGVDRVLDLTRAGSADLLGEGRFGTVHCHCVLEHVRDVFAMARSIERVLRPGGRLYVSAPFAWRVHRIPVDLWRFTPQAIDYLFPHLEFAPETCAFSTRDPSAFHPIDSPPELPLGSGLRRQPAALSFAIRLLRRLRWDGGHLSRQRLLEESNLMMIGTRRTQPTHTFLTGA